MTAIQISKLHATGNDFIVTRAKVAGAEAVLLCDRQHGIGADGLLLLGPGADGSDATMTLFNADGGSAEMSGNGARCIAWAARRAGYGSPDRLIVDTGGGRRALDLVLDAQGDVRYATCDMGAVTFDPSVIPLDAASSFDLIAIVGDVEYIGDAAGIGNPHLVLLVEDPEQVDVTNHGPVLEHDVRFPTRTNVEFISCTPGEANAIDMRVWERGVGETLSCGTGACASAAVAHRRGLVGDEVSVHVRGGDLSVALGSRIRLGGPVVHQFDREIDLSELRDRRT